MTGRVDGARTATPAEVVGQRGLAAPVRTLLRTVDGLAGYLVGPVCAASSEKRQRPGDTAARTLAVRD